MTMGETLFLANFKDIFRHDKEDLRRSGYGGFWDKIREGKFDILDTETIDFNGIDACFDNEEVLFLLSHGFYMQKKYKLCEEAFEALHRMCFIDSDCYTEEDINYEYSCYADIYRATITREEVINTLKKIYRSNFIFYESVLLGEFSLSTDSHIQDIFKLCSDSKDEEIRAICCSKISNPKLFEFDSSERIQKIVRLRTTIDENINDLSDSERDLFYEILAEEENGLFKIEDGLCTYDEDKICVVISGNEVFDYSCFVDDRDIYCNIMDKRILVYDLLQKIIKGEVKLKEGSKYYQSFCKMMGERKSQTK